VSSTRASIDRTRGPNLLLPKNICEQVDPENTCNTGIQFSANMATLIAFFLCVYDPPDGNVPGVVYCEPGHKDYGDKDNSIVRSKEGSASESLSIEVSLDTSKDLSPTDDVHWPSDGGVWGTTAPLSKDEQLAAFGALLGNDDPDHSRHENHINLLEVSLVDYDAPEQKSKPKLDCSVRFEEGEWIV
jgi:hypothetical protein